MVIRSTRRRIVALSLVLLSFGALAADTGAKPPQWHELTLAQRQILAPVATKWNGMTDRQRFKLLDMTRQYPGMTPEQRQKVQSQLRDWHELTPEQREQARQRYQQFKQLPPEKREEVKQKWQEKKVQSETPAPPPETPSTLAPTQKQASRPHHLNNPALNATGASKIQILSKTRREQKIATPHIFDM